MQDYSKMSDFQINKKVLEIKSQLKPLSYAHDADKRSAGVRDNNDLYHWFDFCNSWADAGPIIHENGICLGYDGISWDASCHLHGICSISDWKKYPENPLRMAMIVFLMIKESQND